jgi:hypothetical protein
MARSKVRDPLARPKAGTRAKASNPDPQDGPVLKLRISRDRDIRGFSLIVAVDPDASNTALAWAVAAGDVYRLAGLVGGGAGREVVPWSTITGQIAWLQERAAETGCTLAEALVVVETQAAHSPWSADVEALRRVRYHFDATCEIAGARYEEAEPGAWQRHVTTAEARRGGDGAIKAAYKQHAIAVLEREVNEDQSAAFGILQWAIEARIGASLIVGKSYVVA